MDFLNAMITNSKYSLPRRLVAAIFSTIVSAVLSVSFSAQAEEVKPQSANLVIELFTSQGCPSSPSADAILRSLADKKDILALSWPVNYWDRMGWKDSLAEPEHAQRQMVYNKFLGKSGVMTPQMVFNGIKAINGSRKRKVLDQVALYQDKKPFDVTPILDITQPTNQDEQGTVSASLSANAALKGSYVRVVFYQATAKVDVKGGQNKGRTLYYKNVVRISPDPMQWDGGKDSFKFRLPKNLNGATHVAILVQNRFNAGEIIGATYQALPTGS